jgi:hypothetical protein
MCLTCVDPQTTHHLCAPATSNCHAPYSGVPPRAKSTPTCMTPRPSTASVWQNHEGRHRTVALRCPYWIPEKHTTCKQWVPRQHHEDPCDPQSNHGNPESSIVLTQSMHHLSQTMRTQNIIMRVLRQPGRVRQVICRCPESKYLCPAQHHGCPSLHFPFVCPSDQKPFPLRGPLLLAQNVQRLRTVTSLATAALSPGQRLE